MTHCRYGHGVFIALFWIAFLAIPRTGLTAGLAHNLTRLIGSSDAVMVTDQQGNIIVSKNSGRQLVPASTLKILTSLVALHYLGPDYRFTTEFFVDAEGNLTVKGYGDPLLISEVLTEIAATLAKQMSVIRNIYVDDSYFADPLTIPGITESTEPYDAPNGALCANFNTVSFRRKNKKFVSGEPQTPLLPFAMDKIKKTGMTKGRITLTHHQGEIALYAGLLLRNFLEQHGVSVSGIVTQQPPRTPGQSLIYTHRSVYPLVEVIENMLAGSSNFMANQLLITSGAVAFGPPGNLEKAVQAAESYASNELGIRDIRLMEGSGISRGNRLTAKSMMKILTTFEPYRHLMRQKGRDQYKTGTLSGVKARAGYIESRARTGERYRYAVLINTPKQSTRPVMKVLLEGLD